MSPRPSWLVEMERTAKAACPGPYSLRESGRRSNLLPNYDIDSDSMVDYGGDPSLICENLKGKNARYIVAASPDRVLALLALVEEMAAALEYTQRTDVIIGHSDAEDGKLRGMPDKIMMRNKCAAALAKYQAGPGSEGGTR